MGTPLIYGKKYHIQNAWNKWQGGFLDTRGRCKDYEPKIGNHLCVTTAVGNNRDHGSGTWEIVPAPNSGRKNGDNVMAMDHILLKNQWSNGAGGYLDTRGYIKDFYPGIANFLCVSTRAAIEATSESTQWTLLSANNDSGIDENEPVSLLNQWNNGKGGFLDTRGYNRDYGPKVGNHLAVSTAWGFNLVSQSGIWRFTPAS